MANKKRALGRGLSALLENADTDVTSKQFSKESDPKVVGSIAEIPVGHIEANPFQPRGVFEEEALVELADSIKEHGIIQPITVRKMGYDKYQLISGERRFRAAQIAEMETLPAYIRVADDQSMLEMSLVENLQRENLDAIEVAISFKRLMEECKLTQEKLSEKVAKKRSTVTNYLRLLKLPAVIQLGIREHKISMGHARAILALSDEEAQLELFKQILDENLSVRKTEQRAGNLGQKQKDKPKPAKKNYLTPDLEGHRNRLSERFESSVELKRNRTGKGRIVINFKSDSDLQRILSLLEEE